jgi:hypothetical protein
LSSSQNEHITRAIDEMVVLDYMPLKLVPIFFIFTDNVHILYMYTTYI